VRIRRGWRQDDLARRAGVSQMTISRIERGHLETLSVARLRSVAVALDIRVDVVARWRAGDLDRLLNARHSQLHDEVARAFFDLDGWTVAPEVSFSIFGERGVIDLLAWHSRRRALLMVELKTDIVDLNELVGTVDRKRRLATTIAADRGWVRRDDRSAAVSAWIVVLDTRTNRRRIAAHARMLRAAFPTDGRSIRGWLRRPKGPIAALSMWPAGGVGSPATSRGPVRRVRRARARPVTLGAMAQSK
jgi:transcriptional regulator with XRE-family HTH domain